MSSRSYIPVKRSCAVKKILTPKIEQQKRSNRREIEGESAGERKRETGSYRENCMRSSSKENSVSASSTQKNRDRDSKRREKDGKETETRVSQ